MEDQDLKHFLRNAYGEHQKEKYNETGSCSDVRLNRKIHKKYEYYDTAKRVRLIDKRTGEVVGETII